MKSGEPLGVLLAGGRSARMGTDKAAVMLGGKPLASWPAAALEAVVSECIQVGGAAIAGLEWPRMPDLREDCGPAAGIEAALTAAHAVREGGVPIIVVGVDVPFVPADLLRFALEAIGRGARMVAPSWDGRWHPLCAAYSPGVLELLQQRLDDGKHGLQGFLEGRATPIGPDQLSGFGDPDRFLMNVNTAADLARAEELLKAGI